MTTFNPECRLCPRLAAHLAEVQRDYPEYHARPVAPFGDKKPRLIIVGLAPGMHGANATGRPFTGDYAGILLFQTLYQFGFANQGHSLHFKDNLHLKNCRITNAVKCHPPDNKPTSQEITTCNRYLKSELADLVSGTVILALGRIAHKATITALGLKQRDYPFMHGHLFTLDGGHWLLDSYHCSRYNTQTRRLTENMFLDIFSKIVEILNITN